MQQNSISKPNNNNMKKLLSIAFLAALLCSCEPSSVRNGRDLYMLYFEETFKDPSSIKVYSEEYEVNENSKVGEVKWTLEVGGKNSFGAMVRHTFHLTTCDVFIRNEDNGEMILKSKLKK